MQVKCWPETECHLLKYVKWIYLRQWVMSKIMFVLVCLVPPYMFCVDLSDFCRPRQGQRMYFWVGRDTHNADSVTLLTGWWECLSAAIPNGVGGVWPWIIQVLKALFVLYLEHKNVTGDGNQNFEFSYLNLSPPDPLSKHYGVEKVCGFLVGNCWSKHTLAVGFSITVSETLYYADLLVCVATLCIKWTL